jgi:hypothetical protein
MAFTNKSAMLVLPQRLKPVLIGAENAGINACSTLARTKQLRPVASMTTGVR